MTTNETHTTINLKKMPNIYGGKVHEFPYCQVYRSEIDGCIVVEIDTGSIPENEKGPLVRVYLNEGCLFENPAL